MRWTPTFAMISLRSQEFERIPNCCSTFHPSMNLRHFLFVCFAGLLLLTGGCSSFYGPHGFGQLVLVVCKVAPVQTADAQQRANRYFTKVAHHQKPRPRGRYVALQTLDPIPKQKEKYLKDQATAQEKAQEVIPWLRRLGIRADHARQAAERCESIPDASLEERVRLALSCFGPRTPSRAASARCGLDVAPRYGVPAACRS